MIGRDRTAVGQAIARGLLAIVYCAAGCLHVLRPQAFLPIVPDWVPWPRDTVIATGWCEIAGAVGLLAPALRRTAGFMLALYAICVLPANIKHALVLPHLGVGALGWWYHAPRLLAQPAIVWWALFAAGITRWPFARASRDTM